MLMGNALLYISSRVSYSNAYVNFEFNDNMLLYKIRFWAETVRQSISQEEYFIITVF